MKTNPVISQIMQEAVATSRKSFGDKLHQVWLYGSYARGDWDEDSDIDCMIVVSEPVDPWQWTDSAFTDFTIDMLNRFGEFPSVYFTDINQFNTSPEFIFQNVKKEGVLYYGE